MRFSSSYPRAVGGERGECLTGKMVGVGALGSCTLSSVCRRAVTSGTLSAAFPAIGTVAVVVDRAGSLETLQWVDIWARLFGTMSAGLSRSGRSLCASYRACALCGLQVHWEDPDDEGWERRFEKRLWALQICTTAILNLIKARRARGVFISDETYGTHRQFLCAIMLAERIANADGQSCCEWRDHRWQPGVLAGGGLTRWEVSTYSGYPGRRNGRIAA